MEDAEGDWDTEGARNVEIQAGEPDRLSDQAARQATADPQSTANRGTASKKRWTVAQRRARPTYLADGAPRAHSLDASGFVMKRHRAQIGALESYYGVTNNVSVGTLTLPWFVILPFGGYSANASVKVGGRLGDKLWGSITTGVLYAQLARPSHDGEAAGQLWAFPTTAALSWRPGGRHMGSAALRYLSVSGGGRYAAGREEIGGEAFTDMVTGIMSWSYRLHPRLALVTRGKLMLWRDDLRIRVTGSSGSDARFSMDAIASTTGRRTAAAVLGAAQVSFRNTHLLMGMGYGSYFVPGLGLVAVSRPIPFPEVDLYVRF